MKISKDGFIEMGKIFNCNNKEYTAMFLSVSLDLYKQIKKEINKQLKEGINLDLHLNDFLYSVNIYEDNKAVICIYWNNKIKWSFITNQYQIFTKELMM